MSNLNLWRVIEMLLCLGMGVSNKIKVIVWGCELCIEWGVVLLCLFEIEFVLWIVLKG